MQGGYGRSWPSCLRQSCTLRGLEGTPKAKGRKRATTWKWRLWGRRRGRVECATDWRSEGFERTLVCFGNRIGFDKWPRDKCPTLAEAGRRGRRRSRPRAQESVAFLRRDPFCTLCSEDRCSSNFEEENCFGAATETNQRDWNVIRAI